MYMAHILVELKDKKLETSKIYTDNMSLTEAVHSTKQGKRKDSEWILLR